MRIANIVEKVRSGSRDPDDFRALRFYIGTARDPEYLYEAIVNYAENSPVVDWSLICRFVRYPSDPMVSAGAINAGGLRHCPLAEFWDEVEKVAIGEEWDPDQDARVQAILALGSAPEEHHQKTRLILRHCLSSTSAVIRDSAAIAAQRCAGISTLDQKNAGAEPGSLLDEVQSEVREWLHR